jgi:hypothetical protein
MPIQLVRHVSQAEKYMKDKLSEGTTLARLVAERTDLSVGIFRLPMPEISDPSEPLDLESGNVHLARDEEESFARVIRAFISNPACALIMQDNEAKMSDPIMEKLPYRHLAVEYGAEVYWRVAGAGLAGVSDNEMLDVVNSTSYFPWTGFFYRDGVSPSIGELTDEDLEHVIRKLVGIAVSAFDYRSFLIWWRDDLCGFPTVD